MSIYTYLYICLYIYVYIYIYIYIYMVGGIPTPLKNTKVNRKDYPIYYGKYKKCSKPPTRYIFGDLCSAVFHIGALVRLCQMDKIHGVLVFRYNSYIYYYLLAVTAISKSRFKLHQTCLLENHGNPPLQWFSQL